MKRWFILPTTIGGLPAHKVYDRADARQARSVHWRRSDAEKIVEALNRAIGDVEQELPDGPHRPG